jgi:hypothetical protein
MNRIRQLLVCPWKPPTTWYGRLTTAVAFSGTVLLSAVACKKAYLYSRPYAREAVLRYKASQNLQEAKTRQEKPIAYYDHKEFNDGLHYYWHQGGHLGIATSLTVYSGVFAVMGVGFSWWSGLSNTLCQQAMRSSLAGVCYGSAILSLGFAVDSFYAWHCRRQIVAPNQAKKFRMQYDSAFPPGWLFELPAKIASRFKPK